MARAKTRSATQAKSATAGRTASTRAKTSRSATSARTKAASRAGRGATRVRNDAITLLKSDHRQVEQWFEQFETTRKDRKQDIARKICDALKVHSQIEEEIFYPAFYEATQEEDLHHEAIVEHEGAKKLIEEIESSGPDNEYFDARVKVLSEMIKHHVNEEEQRDGMFAKARSSDMNLAALGEQLAARKEQLESSPEALKALGRAKDAGKGLLARLASAA